MANMELQAPDRERRKKKKKGGKKEAAAAAFMGQEKPAKGFISNDLPVEPGHAWEIESFTLSTSLSCCRKERL